MKLNIIQQCSLVPLNRFIFELDSILIFDFGMLNYTSFFLLIIQF